jgi:hypothetical protein
VAKAFQLNFSKHSLPISVEWLTLFSQPIIAALQVARTAELSCRQTDSFFFPGTRMESKVVRLCTKTETDSAGS